MRICPVAERAILYEICAGILPGVANCRVLVHSVQAAGNGFGGVGPTAFPEYHGAWGRQSCLQAGFQPASSER